MLTVGKFAIEGCMRKKRAGRDRSDHRKNVTNTCMGGQIKITIK